MSSRAHLAPAPARGWCQLTHTVHEKSHWTGVCPEIFPMLPVKQNSANRHSMLGATWGRQWWNARQRNKVTTFTVSRSSTIYKQNTFFRGIDSFGCYNNLRTIIHKSQPNSLITLTFRSHHETFIRRSWYSVLLDLDVTISCRIKKTVAAYSDEGLVMRPKRQGN